MARRSPSGCVKVRRGRVPRLTDLILDDRNANRGTSRGQQLLGESLKTNGAGRSVLTDRDGRVIAGNKTVAQAKALGLPIQIVPSDGRTLIVVQRDDLDLHADPRARALAIADNRIAELDLDWDPEVLAQFRTEGLDLGAFWTDQEWAQLVGPTVPVDPAEDHVLAPGPTTITRGDLFTLDRHRLLCGDATDPGDVARLLGDVVPALMTTDPPYGVELRPELAAPRVSPAADGGRPGAARTTARVAGGVPAVSGRGRVRVARGARHGDRGDEPGERPASCCARRSSGSSSTSRLSRGDYHWQHEPAGTPCGRGRPRSGRATAPSRRCGRCPT